MSTNRSFIPQDYPLRKRPILNNSFQVNIGDRMFSFTKVKNISRMIEVETVREGGNNWSVHNLAKPTSSSHKLVLEQGFLADSGKDPGLTPGTRVFNVSIMVMEHGKVRKSYSFNEGIVTRWEISDFDSLQGQLIYNTIEILHDGLREGQVT